MKAIDDLIRRQDVIDAIQNEISKESHRPHQITLLHAKRRIEKLPSAQTCEDCVSRDAVHEMLESVPINMEDKWFNWLQKACLRLAALPSVQPKHTCVGCKHYGMWENEVEYGYNSPCTKCRRRMNDNYEQ